MHNKRVESDLLRRRFAPGIKRMQRTVVHASTLARLPAVDPLRR